MSIYNRIADDDTDRSAIGTQVSFRPQINCTGSASSAKRCAKASVETSSVCAICA